MVERGRFEGRSLVLYFLVAFSFTWFFWVSEALAVRGMLGSSILVDFLLSPHNPAAWGPLVAAFSLTYRDSGKEGLRRLLGRAVDYRFGRSWWLPVFFLLPAITGGAFLLSMLTEGITPELPWLSDPFVLIVGYDSFFSILLFRGPLQEEFGWRGYALPRLLNRFNALVSSVVLGLIWFAWHIPYYAWVSEEAVFESAVWGLVLSHVLLTILFTWLYNNTGGSILAALIFHTTISFSWVLFSFVETELGGLFYLILLLIAPIIVTVVWGPERLVRKRR